MESVITQKARIMVVEDEAVVASDIKMSLEEMGYDACCVAASAEEAMEMIDREKPELLLMDIMLGGGMDGIQAAERVRSEYNIPVIFITAYADEETLERAKITEPFGYIVKPVEDRQLKISIEMALYKHKMEKERMQLIEDLQTALGHIKTLSGLLPICAWCKKIRDDQGYWDEVEAYVAKHSDATFTHGICPDCFKKVKEQEEKKKGEN